MKAKAIMTEKVISVNENATINEVVEILLKNKISGIPVVDKNQTVIGIISERDIIFQEKNLTPPLFLNIFDGIIQLGQTKFKEEFLKMSAYKVKDLMTKKVYTVTGETEHTEIADLMVKKNINRVPVVDQNNKLIGIITRADIIKAIYEQ